MLDGLIDIEFQKREALVGRGEFVDLSQFDDSHYSGDVIEEEVLITVSMGNNFLDSSLSQCLAIL